ncbi:MFS transporter [Herbaspirillum frisingense]|uniref:MFS transporter n=1 Tax=Herbaspirillum frisingense TaxID=92645 RepID=UPI001602935A|nr:MFS transporter [Herbaspirillum frisingense]QNB06712.1 MFS transporter [Herbaspirillum frisingense]
MTTSEHTARMSAAAGYATEAVAEQALTDTRAISARLDRLPATRAVWKLIALLSLGFFFELYDLLFSGYVAPGLVKSGILTATTAGLFGTTGVASFIAALFGGLFVGTITCGFLADRFGRRAIFTYAMLWYVTANIVMAFQETAFGLNLWRFISGLGIGVELVTIGTYMSELAPKHMRGRAFAICQTVGFCAVPIVAFLSYLLIPTSYLGLDGWRWVVLIGGVSALFIWYFRRNLPESPRWLASKGRFDEADAILQDLEARVRAQNGGTLPEVGKSEPVAQKSKFAEMWQPPYRSRTIMLIIFHIFQTIGFYGFANWVPTLLVKQGITVSSSLLYTTIIGLAAPMGPLLGYWIADRFERKHVIVTMAALNIVAGLLFSQAAGPVLIISLGVLLTLASNISSFTYHTYQQELYPTSIRARAVGFVYSWSRLSAIFTSFVIAFCLKNFGVLGVFVFISGAMFFVMLAIGLMGPRTLGKSLESISH